MGVNSSSQNYNIYSFKRLQHIINSSNLPSIHQHKAYKWKHFSELPWYDQRSWIWGKLKIPKLLFLKKIKSSKLR